MIAIITLLTVLTMSLLIVRVATVALTLTGISRPLARFQARSAFTGVGFTTAESEKIVNHPVRRRIVMMLMLLGNAGIVTTIATLIGGVLAAEQAGGKGLLLKLGLLVAGLTGLWAIAYSAWVDQKLSRLIATALKRWTNLDVRDYANLLHVSGGYGVSEMLVCDGDWLAGRTLAQLGLSHEGVIVLGVQRPGDEYLGAPRGSTQLRAGDQLLLYGRADRLTELDQRRSGIGGNLAHADAVADQVNIERDEQHDQQAPQPGKPDR